MANTLRRMERDGLIYRTSSKRDKRQSHVITSYSIHYTKLYEFYLDIFAQLSLGLSFVPIEATQNRNLPLSYAKRFDLIIQFGQ